MFLKRDFDAIFRSAAVEDGQLTLQFASNAPALIRPTDDGRAEVIRAGQSLTIPFSKRTQLVERHSGIIFDPLPTPLSADGFSITSYFDSTSVGGGETVKKALLVKTPNDTGGPPELRWLPPDMPVAEIAAIIHGKKIADQQIAIQSASPSQRNTPISTIDQLPNTAPSVESSPQSSSPSATHAVDKSSRYVIWIGIGGLLIGLLIYFWIRFR